MTSPRITKIASQWLRTALVVTNPKITIRALSLSLRAAFLDMGNETLALRIFRGTDLVSTPAEESEAKRKSFAIDLMLPQEADPKIKMRTLALMWSGAILDYVNSPEGKQDASLENFSAQIHMVSRKLVSTEEDSEAKRIALRLITKLGIGRS
jgi:hypothetical protein